MWMVYDFEDGLVGIFEDKIKAVKEYKAYVESAKEYVDREGQFSLDERVILAKVERQIYGYETDEKATGYDENGEEFETGDNLWDWKEEIY
ncbi:hypothetical protein [Lederbergia galactosidilytica]|uniref:Uncharacterized protein n=1 Tax=Lederbergia galactosidilytica TaxID=217031 RepID=A0A177ZQ36_9BACI|nr:hypothetical protein [Lederbergia galactosidilytica]OAK70077.1 hypothetical protein ABB05_12915 [Lederbergia galactosidilytica]